MLRSRFSNTGQCSAIACPGLVIGLSLCVNTISGCASMSEDEQFRQEMEVERMAEWEQACHRSGGVVWSEDARKPIRKCVSKRAAQQSLARLSMPSWESGRIRK
jgi:hypothetical protein